MQRFGLFMVLALVTSGSSAQARSFSFAIGGHRVTIEAPRYCRSARCLSISMPGLHQKGSRSEPGDETAAVAVPTRVPSAPTVTVASPLVVESTAAVPAPPAVPSPPPSLSMELAAAGTRPIPPPASPPAAAGETMLPSVAAASQHSAEPPAPLGDWRTEAGTGTVRIEPCGAALCGYLLDASGGAKGETVLVNMKPTRMAREWSGGVFSRASGNTYYGTITMTRPDTLRVEACALGHFFCSSNSWTRVEHNPDEMMMMSRRPMPPPQGS